MPKRNIKALQALRKIAESIPDDQLHMRNYTEVADCGTVHCLLGWAVEFPPFRSCVTPDERENKAYLNALERVNRKLGITTSEGVVLFAGDIDTYGDPHDVKKSEVLWNIDQLIEGLEPLPYQAVVTLGTYTRLADGSSEYDNDIPCVAGGVPNAFYVPRD